MSAKVEERHRRAAVCQLLHFVGTAQEEWVRTGIWPERYRMYEPAPELARNAQARADAEAAGVAKEREGGVYRRALEKVRARVTEERTTGGYSNDVAARSILGKCDKWIAEAVTEELARETITEKAGER